MWMQEVLELLLPLSTFRDHCRNCEELIKNVLIQFKKKATSNQNCLLFGRAYVGKKADKKSTWGMLRYGWRSGGPKTHTGRYHEQGLLLQGSHLAVTKESSVHLHELWAIIPDPICPPRCRNLGLQAWSEGETGSKAVFCLLKTKAKGFVCLNKTCSFFCVFLMCYILFSSIKRLQKAHWNWNVKCHIHWKKPLNRRVRLAVHTGYNMDLFLSPFWAWIKIPACICIHRGVSHWISCMCFKQTPCLWSR